MRSQTKTQNMNEFKGILLQSLGVLFRPLVRILIKYQISFGETSNVLRQVFVKVAHNEFTLPNGKQTYSNTAAKTGIDRKMVQDILHRSFDEQLTGKPINKGLSVVNAWIKSKEFTNTRGKPKVLPLKGKGSFESLVKIASADIPPKAILEELKRVGVVEQLEDNSVRLLNDAYIPTKDEKAMANILFMCAEDLLVTGGHNLSHPKDKRRFQRQVQYSGIPESLVDEFKEFSEQKSQELIIEIGQWLEDKKKNSKPSPGENTKRLGLGIYHVETDNKREKS